jgi:outer membrane receptor for Fe3+-dicitrate
MKPFDILIKKKPFIISLEILMGISSVNLHAEPMTDETQSSAEAEATDQSQQATQAKKSDNTDELEAVEVEADGRGKNLIGIAGSASEGEVSQKQFEHRPLSRNGELIEVIPGAVATQHSGSGYDFNQLAVT